MNSVLSFDEKLIQHFRTLSLSDSLLAKACEYSLASPGKRLRPRFAQEASRLVGLNSEAAEKIAFAIELIHIFSLVHDDLPCLDNDDFRRGIPTTHKKFNEAQAMLAGDALFSAAMETFVQCGDRIEKINFLNAFRFFTACIGPKGMIAGQSLELELEDPSPERLLFIQSLKTTALFKAAILTPLLLAGKTEADPLFQECLAYAEAFGFAFQIADDLDDELQDAENGKKNILSLFGRDEAKDLALNRLQDIAISTQFSATPSLIQKLSQ